MIISKVYIAALLSSFFRFSLYQARYLNSTAVVSGIGGARVKPSTASISVLSVVTVLSSVQAMVEAPDNMDRINKPAWALGVKNYDLLTQTLTLYPVYERTN